MRILAFSFLSLFIVLASHEASAANEFSNGPTSEHKVTMSPPGADIKRVGESRFTVTFSATNGSRIIAAGEALFCYRLNVDGSCYANSVIHSVKDASTARAEPTLVDRIVVSNDVAAAARDVADNFYYVRRLTLAIQGAEKSIFIAFPLKLVDPKKVSLVSVSLYGEDGMGDRRRAVEITPANVQTGFLSAEMIFSGEGKMNGWWEIHWPGDPLLRRIDRFADASLTDHELSTKRSFRPAMWFHRDVKASGNREGKLTLRGPSYKDLPMSVEGKYDVLLHLLRNKHEPGNGPTGGMPLMLMTYSVETQFQFFGDGFLGFPWFQWVPKIYSMPKPGLAWDRNETNGETVRLVLMAGGAPTDKSLRTPFANGRVDIPADWLSSTSMGEDVSVGFTVLDTSGIPLASESVVKVINTDNASGNTVGNTVGNTFQAAPAAGNLGDATPIADPRAASGTGTSQ